LVLPASKSGHGRIRGLRHHPARNEEKSLPLLLKDLLSSRLNRLRLFVSTTIRQTQRHKSRSLSRQGDFVARKPEGWTGKTWACQNGANAANGDLLLFLDADVRSGITVSKG
jgi:4,4'-diaponeurosporenoate glycosyltransferase